MKQKYRKNEYQYLPRWKKEDCQVPGCDKAADYRSHRICNAHYAQWKEFGCITKCKVNKYKQDIFDLDKVPIKDPDYNYRDVQLSDEEEQDYGRELRSTLSDLDSQIDNED